MADSGNDPQEENVDELLASIEAPHEDRAMSAPEPAAATETPAADAAPVWNGQEWEFEWGGKKVVPDSREKAKIWMGQGYNYSQRMGELNRTHSSAMTELQSKQQQIAALEAKLKPFMDVNSYAEQNPQWWQSTVSAYQQAQQQQQLNPGIQQALQPFQEKIQSMEGILGQWQQAQEAEQAKHYDTLLDQQMGELRSSNPKMNFDSVDESGKTLEMRILEHAQKEGIPTYKTAFRDYLHEQLIEQAKADAKEAVAKGAQANAKKGILSTTQSPTKGAQQVTNVKGKSYGDLAREGLAEFGITA